MSSRFPGRSATPRTPASNMAPPTTKAVLTQALLLPRKNPKLALVVFLLALIPRFLLHFTIYRLQSLYVADIATNVKVLRILGIEFNSPEAKPLLSKITGDAKLLSILVAVSTVVAYVVSVFECIVTVHSADSIRLRKQVSSGGLLSKVVKSWKGTFLTFLPVTILLCGCVTLLAFLHAFLVLVLYSSWVLMGLALIAVSIPALASLIYVGLVCDIARVVAVVGEKGRYGIDALAEAVEVLRGNRVKGFQLALVLFVADYVAWFVHGIVAMESVREGTGVVVLVGLGVASVGLRGVVAVGSLAVYTVFYRDSREGDGEGLGMELPYQKLPTEE